MKTYTVQENDNLGTIAQKFGMTSWNYLYEKNKDAVGDNPDLLKPGTKLSIPAWDSTTGDEKIEAKDADPHEYTGGLCYRYPWVPLSVTLCTGDKSIYTEKDSSGKQNKTFSSKKKFSIKAGATGTVLASGEISESDELELLVPDAEEKTLFIDDRKYSIG